MGQDGAVGGADRDPVVCRCEAVRVGDLLMAQDAWAIDSLRQLKLLTRAGMGICQGRVCAPVLEALARGWGWDPAGALASRPPARPWTMQAALAAVEPDGERDNG